MTTSINYFKEFDKIDSIEKAKGLFKAAFTEHKNNISNDMSPYVTTIAAYWMYWNLLRDGRHSYRKLSIHLRNAGLSYFYDDIKLCDIYYSWGCGWQIAHFMFPIEDNSHTIPEMRHDWTSFTSASNNFDEIQKLFASYLIIIKSDIHE